MQKPLIGITTYAKNDLQQFHLYSNYPEAVVRAGGMPILIPPVGRFDSARLDGLILAGGGDIHPQRYHGQWHDTFYKVDEQRDALEFDLCEQAFKRELPVLAICRGMQVANLVLGGSIHPHLPDAYPHCIAHRQNDGSPILHDVTLTPKSRLAKILEVEQCTISSQHHQALDRVADCLRVSATAEDGIIEAVDCLTHPMIAVQWHPEHTAASDPIQQRLFNHLLAFIKGEQHAFTE